MDLRCDIVIIEIMSRNELKEKKMKQRNSKEIIFVTMNNTR